MIESTSLSFQFIAINLEFITCHTLEQIGRRQFNSQIFKVFIVFKYIYRLFVPTQVLIVNIVYLLMIVSATTYTTHVSVISTVNAFAIQNKVRAVQMGCLVFIFLFSFFNFAFVSLRGQVYFIIYKIDIIIVIIVKVKIKFWNFNRIFVRSVGFACFIGCNILWSVSVFTAIILLI